MSNLIGFNKLFDTDSFDNGTKQLAKFLERITDEITKAEIAADDLTKALGAKLRQEISQLSSASKDLNKQMVDMNNKMSQFQSTVSNTKKVISDYERENARLRTELEKLKNAQTQVNTTVKSGGDSMAGLSKGLVGLATGASLVSSGITMLKTQIIAAVQSTIEFEKVMQEVRAVTQASDEQFKLLVDNANKLGSSTEKTAQQIAEAQKELAKLGFTIPEILLATKSIVDLSTATGEDLVKSAEVAAATIKSFGLDVDQLSRVTDVMTKSFIISALDLEKFRESMKLVAPIAASTNVEIETVTAALAKLSDTGISGSLSGTAMRNLLGSMADPTEKLTKYIGQYDETLKDGIKSSEDFTRALKVLKDSNIDLEKAVQMVDKRAQSAFFTLVEYAEDVEYLALELKYLNNETEEVAKTMRDQLSNDIKIAESAFDSMRRNLVDGFIPTMRESVQTFTQINEIIRLVSEGALFHNEVISTVVAWYIKWLKFIHPVSMSLKVLNTALGVVGLSFDDIVEKGENAKLTQTFESLSENVGKIVDDFAGFDKATKDSALATKILAEGTENYTEVIKNLRDEYPKISKSASDTDFLKLLQGQTKRATEATYGNIAALKSEQDTLEDLRGVLEEKAKTEKLSAEETERLKKINQAIIVVQNLRFEWEEKLIAVRKKSGLLTEDEINALKEQAEAIKRVTELQGQLAGIYAKIAEERAKFAFDEEEDFIEKSQLLVKYRDARLATIKQQLNAELASIDKAGLSEQETLLKRKIAYAKYTQAKLGVEQDFSKQIDTLNEKRLADEEKFLKKVNEIRFGKESPKDRRENAIEKAEDDFKSLMDLLLKQKKERDKIEEEADKTEEQRAEERRQRTIRVAEQTAQELAKIVRFTFDNNQLMREKELAEIDSWEEEQTRIAGDNEDARIRVQQQAESRRKELKRKQALDNRNEAMFQIAIDTAANVVRSILQNGGIPKGIPFGLAAAALGAAQLALVASRPLPAFAKGTDNSPEGFAEVGERGRELVRDGRTGKWGITPDKSTVTYLTKGSQVIPNAQTEMILKNDPNVLADNYLKNKVVQVNTPQIDYNKITNGFREAISTIPINITNFDQNGVANFVVKKSVKLRRLNKRY
jgi:TP901 family phage tail tape measure protein